MPFIQNAIDVNGNRISGSGTGQQHLLDHYRRGLPLTWRDTRVKMTESGSEQRLPHISPSSCSMVYAHSILSHSGDDPSPVECRDGVACPPGSALESLSRLDRSGRPAGRGETPRYSKCSW